MQEEFMQREARRLRTDARVLYLKQRLETNKRGICKVGTDHKHIVRKVKVRKLYRRNGSLRSNLAKVTR